MIKGTIKQEIKFKAAMRTQHEHHRHNLCLRDEQSDFPSLQLLTGAAKTQQIYPGPVIFTLEQSHPLQHYQLDFLFTRTARGCQHRGCSQGEIQPPAAA